MDIREAIEDDNLELQELQARCPQGTTLIVSTVNTPDFFARVKVYEDYKVFVACENNRIIGSAACAIREAVVNGKVVKIGHGFQAFVDPEYRGRHIAGQLHQVRENYLRQSGAVLAYTIVMEGNIPSLRYIERQGFKRHHTLIMPGIMVYKKMDITSQGYIRSMVPGDLAAVASLINQTWQSYELYEPMTADSLAKLISRTPAYSYDNIFVLEENDHIKACLGFWDWSQVTTDSTRT
jgi:GNAT superfamily N-acetyltransferase